MTKSHKNTQASKEVKVKAATRKLASRKQGSKTLKQITGWISRHKKALGILSVIPAAVLAKIAYTHIKKKGHGRTPQDGDDAPLHTQKPIFYKHNYYGVTLYYTSETWESCRGPDWYNKLMYADVYNGPIPHNAQIIDI
jgi:hypothetical protein